MFKQLTNVQAPKTDQPELNTTPTGGTMKLNLAAGDKIKSGVGDFVAVLEDTDPESEFNGVWLTKGNPKTDTEDQFGSKLSSTTGKNGGSLQFSSELSYRALKGNDNTRMVYSVGDAQTHPQVSNPIYKLTFLREEVKNVIVKGKKDAAIADATAQS